MPSANTLPLEMTMRHIATLVTGIAVILMAVGFVAAFLLQDLPSIPGAPALPPSSLLRFSTGDWGVWAMSAGILLLALLPLVRVFLSLILFLRQRDLLDVAVALLVLVELILSMGVRG